MGRIVFINGHYVDEQHATISVFDRGFLFADGVYEVASILEGRLVDNEAHLRRLGRSMKQLDMPWPATQDEIIAIQHQLVKRNSVNEGMLYLQITRGPAERSFSYPTDPKPSLFMFTQAKSLIQCPEASEGIHVITVMDLRWKRRDIKTVGLLPASMAKQAAQNAGANEAWLVDDGYITEGSSNNAYIVETDGTIVTRNLSNDLLAGITRAAILKLAEHNDVNVVERAFSVEEAYAASEAFITSASTFVWPVVKIDDTLIGDGLPGPVTQRLRDLYISMALESLEAR
jgi:D-alanine transaminase